MADERPAGYGRRVIDLDQSWRTERLELEPLTVEHATELAPVLDDAVIAHIHPAHLASQRVARAAGLSPTGEVHDGEVRWAVPLGCFAGRGA